LGEQTKISLVELHGSEADVAAVQTVLELSPGYAKRLTGNLPDPSAAHRLFSYLPEGTDPMDRIVFGVYFANQIIGCCDITRKTMAQGIGVIGLFQIRELDQGKGYGSAAFALLEQIIRSWNMCHKIRLSIPGSDDAGIAFFRRMGFSETLERSFYQVNSTLNELVIMEKSLLDWK